MSCSDTGSDNLCGEHAECASFWNPSLNSSIYWCVCDPGYSHFPEFNFFLYLQEDSKTSAKIIRQFYDSQEFSSVDSYSLTPLEAFLPCTDEEIFIRLAFSIALLCCVLALFYNVPALNSRRRVVRQIPLLFNMAFFIFYAIYRIISPERIYGLSNYTSLAVGSSGIFVSSSTSVFLLKFISYQIKSVKKGFKGKGKENLFYSLFLKYSKPASICFIFLDIMCALCRSSALFGNLETSPDMSIQELEQVLDTHRRVGLTYMASSVYQIIRGVAWSTVNIIGFKAVIQDMRFIVEADLAGSTKDVTPDTMKLTSQRTTSFSVSSKMLSFGSTQDGKTSVLSKIRLPKRSKKSVVERYSKDKTVLYCRRTIPMMKSLGMTIECYAFFLLLSDSVIMMTPALQHYYSYTFAFSMAGLGISSGFIVHTTHFAKLKIMAETKKLAKMHGQKK